MTLIVRPLDHVVSKRTKWIFIVLILVVAVLVIAFIRQATKPLEQQVLAANKIEFIGEDFPADGGSFAFFFRLPYRQPMALLVRNRQERMGNPDFQEIWLDGHGGFNPHVDVQPGSELESKLVALLRTATLRTNAADRYSAPPRAERLIWVIERIQDRETKW